MNEQFAFNDREERIICVSPKEIPMATSSKWLR